MNIGNFIITIFDSLLSLVNVLFDFLTYTFVLNLPGYDPIEVSVLAILAGTGVVIGILWSVLMK